MADPSMRLERFLEQTRGLEFRGSVRERALDRFAGVRIDEDSAPFFSIDDQAVVLVESEALGPDSMRGGAGQRLEIGNELPE